jgi:hypothetical protein
MKGRIMKEILAFLLALLAAVGILAILVPLYSIWFGFIFSKLWLWLLVPVFALKPLTIAQAMAVGTVLGYCFYVETSHLAKKDVKSEAHAAFVMPFFRGALLLLWAYILKGFI